MSALDDNKLLELNCLGIVPGPAESEESFHQRAVYCLSLKKHLSKELHACLGTAENTDSLLLKSANDRLSTLYDINVNWIPIFFSNYKLPCWQGGCAWIFQVSSETPTAALIQLRRVFKHSPSYLKLYHRNELLEHELTHVGRMMFEEPKFEEIFAYRTSPSRLRSFFGPLIQSSSESVIFILTLFLVIVFDFFLLAMNRMDAYSIALWLKVIPIGMLAFALWRLTKHQKCLKRCLNNLKECLANEDLALKVAYRLQDKEIEAFSTLSAMQIQEYAHSLSTEQLRWKVIYKAYFGKSISSS